MENGKDKRMKKKSLIALGMAVMMLCTACQGGSDEAKAESKKGSEKTVMNIWIAGSGDADSDKAYKTVLDTYCEKNTDVDYQLTYIPWSDYFTKLNTGLAGASGPDIFMLGYGQIGSVQRAGNLLDLSEYIPQDWDGYDDFYENILEICQRDGDYYALFKPSNRTIFYRKDIAEQNQVTEEELNIKSPEDFEKLVEKMTVRDDSGNVVTYGLEIDPDEVQELFTYMGMFTDEPTLWDDDYKAVYDQDAGIQAMEYMNKLYESGNVCFQDAAAGTTGVASGVAAMAIDANQGYVTDDSAFPGQIGCIKNEMPTLLIGDYLAANSNSKNPDTAADMLLHMFSKDSLKQFAEIAGHYSGRKSLNEDYIKINPDYENIVYSYDKSFSYGKPMHPNFGEAQSNIGPAMESVFNGTEAAAALKDSAAQWNAVVEASK